MNHLKQTIARLRYLAEHAKQDHQLFPPVARKTPIEPESLRKIYDPDYPLDISTARG